MKVHAWNRVATSLGAVAIVGGFVGVCFYAMGCGFSVDKGSNSSAEKWSYHFTENGCDTGEHAYDKKEDYCLALKNESTNKGCAPRMRVEASQKDCR